MSKIDIKSLNLRNDVKIKPMPELRQNTKSFSYLETNDENMVVSPKCQHCPYTESFPQLCSLCRMNADDQVRKYSGYSSSFVEDDCHCSSTYQHVNVVYCGDWEWLARILGLSGPNGTYFCPFCYVKLDDLQSGKPHSPLIFEKYKHLLNNEDKTNFVARMLEELVYHNEEFLKSGMSRDDVKLFYNCEHSPLIKGCGAVLKHTSTMVLHLKLGMGKLMLDFFDEKAIELDHEVRKYKGHTDFVEKQHLEQELQLHKQIEKCDEQIQHLEDAVSTINGNAAELIAEKPEYHEKINKTYIDKSRDAIDHRKTVNEIKAQAKPLLEQIKEIKLVRVSFEKALEKLEKDIKEKIGPFLQKIRNVLDDLHLQRQVYHSGAIVGNDINKVMKPDVIKKLNKCFAPLIIRSVNGGVAQFSTNSFKQKLGVFHRKVKQIFDIMSLPRAICKHEVAKLAIRCYSLGNWLPVNFEDVHLIRKFHVLVYHVPEKAFMRATVGMEAEQCLESIHPVINKLKRTYATVQNKEHQLGFILKQQWLKTDPDLPDFHLKKKREE